MVMRLSPSRNELNGDLKPLPIEGAQARNTSLGIGQPAMPKVTHAHLKRTKTTLEQKRSIRKQIEATRKSYNFGSQGASPAARHDIQIGSVRLSKELDRGVNTPNKEAGGDYNLRASFTPKLNS